MLNKRQLKIAVLQDFIDVREKMEKHATDFEKDFPQVKLNLNFHPNSRIVLNEIPEKLIGAEIVLADMWSVEEEFLQKIPSSVKWIQSVYAGMMYLSPSVIEKLSKVTVTKLGNVAGDQMAEYTMMAILASKRELVFQIHHQKHRKWLDLNPAVYPLNKAKGLNELCVGILGGGSIGIKIAEMCNRLGMKVIALVRSHRPSDGYVSQYFTSNELPELLCQSDYICNVLPSTKDTIGLLNNDVLQNCEGRHTTFINIGRGDIISEQSLIKALEKKWIKLAFLDVFENEPLPTSSELWNMDNVVVTPHIAYVPMVNDIIKVFFDNLRRYVKSESLLYTFDWLKGY